VKSTYVLGVWLSVFLSAGVATQSREVLRPLDVPAREALERGSRESATFLEVIAELETTGVIVHVASGNAMPFGVAGTTRLVTVTTGWRYFRVTLSNHLGVDERASVLAHELQHVLEIVRSSAATQQSVRHLYESIGQPVAGTTNAFETVQAAGVGMQVWRELRLAGRRARRVAQSASQ
jgi:hypothetical protein